MASDKFVYIILYCSGFKIKSISKIKHFKLLLFLQNFKILTQVRRSQTVFVFEVLTDYRMFLCTLMEVTASITEIYNLHCTNQM